MLFIKVPIVVDALFPGGKPLPAWGTGGDTDAALAVDLPAETAEGCGVSLVFSISSSIGIGGGSGDPRQKRTRNFGNKGYKTRSRASVQRANREQIAA